MKIPNCLHYKNISKAYEVSQCEFCDKGYYLRTPINCEPGEAENCAFYAQSSNSCTQCLNGYYLKGDICFEHSLVDNCVIYDS